MQAQLFVGKSGISHFMPALESLDFCVPSFPPVVWDWIFRQDFSQVGAFVVFTGLVQLWALSHSVVYTCPFDWRPAGTEWASYLLLVCLPSHWDIWKIPDCEVKSMASYAGLCQSQIVAAKAQSLEHVVSSRAAIAVSAYCLQHLTIQHEASCSSVKFTGPQKCDIVLRAEWEMSVSTILLNIIADGVQQFVIHRRCFNASYSHNLKRNIVLEVNSCLFNSITPAAPWKLCADWTFSFSGWILFMDQFGKWNILLICCSIWYCV